MKAQLTFDLEEEDDRQAHLRCVKATSMAIVLFDVTHNLEKKISQRLEHVYDDNVHLAVRMVFEEIGAELEDNGINLEDLIS